MHQIISVRYYDVITLKCIIYLNIMPVAENLIPGALFYQMVLNISNLIRRRPFEDNIVYFIVQSLQGMQEVLKVAYSSQRRLK